MSDRTPGHTLKTLLLAEHTPPAIGGREALLASLVRNLPPERTCLLAPGAAGAGPFDRSVAVPIRRCTRLCPPPLAPLLKRKHFEWQCKRWRPDLIVAFGLRTEGSCALAHKHATGTPFVLHLDGPELVVARRDRRKGSEKARKLTEILDEGEAIVTSTEACRLEAYRNGVLPHHLHVVPIGVDLDRFAPGARSADLASSLRVGRGLVLVTVARDDGVHDLGTLFRALAALRAQRRGAALVVVGAVDERRWRKDLKALRVERAVRFTGPVAASDMPEYLRLGDVYVAASREDRDRDLVHGPDVALVEAMACGLPIVATRTPVTEELTGNGDVGLLVEPEAHAKLARAVSEIVKTPERRQEFATAAREQAEEVHDARETGRVFREFLEVVHFRRLRRGRLTPEPAGDEGTARPAA